MNICIVNLRENNPNIGGVERVSYELGHDWMKKGHNVFFLSQYKSTIKKSYQSLCKEFFLPNRDKADSTENVEFFIKLLKENNVDIILNQVAEINTERPHDTIPPDAQAAYRKSYGINVPNN